jgi:hypothetical protein
MPCAQLQVTIGRGKDIAENATDASKKAGAGRVTNPHDTPYRLAGAGAPLRGPHTLPLSQSGSDLPHAHPWPAAKSAPDEDLIAPGQVS